MVVVQPLPRLCLKLIVITYIMTHSLTLIEDTRSEIFSMLMNPPDTPYEPLTSPRWLNKELKFLMSRLHTDLLKNVLELIHKTLRDCRDKKSLWAVAFIGLLTLSMVTESMQHSIRCKEETDKEMHVIPREDTTAELYLSRMDEKLDLLVRIFQKKYGIRENKEGKQKTEFNPVRDLSDRALLDQPARRLAGDVDRILMEYRKISAFSL